MYFLGRFCCAFGGFGRFVDSGGWIIAGLGFTDFPKLKLGQMK